MTTLPLNTCCFLKLVDTGYNRGYTLGMKTAVSVSDELFERAERFAKAARVSRSRLYADALVAYLNEKEAEDVTNTLNEVYSEESSSVDSTLFDMAITSLAKDEWK